MLGLTQWDGDEIKKHRKNLKVTQTALANKLGCRQQTISEWECCSYLPRNAYQKLLTLVFNDLYMDMNLEHKRFSRKERSEVLKKKETVEDNEEAGVDIY